ncbi:MAG: Sorbitol dehydrogenase [Firmicutes bacterium ADurb.Bin182]|nr:MAG: Sorbitol dehydrogenase [Firmicutes bacterium ADurb.Bin182]
MKAVYYIADDHMEVRDIPVPTPRADEYLVRIDACGICGSDVEGYLGKTGRRIAPMIMGHECAGTVVQVPSGGMYERGLKVAIFPKFFCGECETCRRGFVNMCPHANFLGVMDYDGAMTEYVCVKEQYLIPYDGISADIASLVEPAAVAYNGINKLSAAEIENAQHILVVGAGTIGLFALLWLKYRGAGHVIVSDAFDFRLDLAKRMGADAAINPLKCDFNRAIFDFTGGAMCDISIEAVGISSTAQSSLDALKLSGRTVWIGNASKMVSVNMQQIVTRELSIKGNYIYSMEDFAECVSLLSKKAIDAEPLITHRMDMSEGVKAFELLKNNRDGKAVKIVLTNNDIRI